MLEDAPMLEHLELDLVPAVLSFFNDHTRFPASVRTLRSDFHEDHRTKLSSRQTASFVRMLDTRAPSLQEIRFASGHVAGKLSLRLLLDRKSVV
jgi:hypothetical protein